MPTLESPHDRILQRVLDGGPGSTAGDGAIPAQPARQSYAGRALLDELHGRLTSLTKRVEQVETTCAKLKAEVAAWSEAFGVSEDAPRKLDDPCEIGDEVPDA